MQYSHDPAPNVSATIDSDTLDMTITVDGASVLFPCDDFNPRAGLTDAQTVAELLGFYSAYAEWAAPGSRAWDGEDMPANYDDQQREALYMVGSDGFYVWADEIAPTCSEGCGRYVGSPGATCPHH